MINGGAAATNSRNVTLALTATDVLTSVTQMRFSNTGTSFSAAEAFAPTKAWSLTSGAGTKTVYVQFKDALGNWSGSVSDTIVFDTTAPTISARTATNITSSSARITWTTNEAATSQVDYGLTTSYGSTTTLDLALVTSHSVVLTGLAPGTIYNFRVRSRDAAGNESVSANSTFTTVAGSDTIAPSVSMSAPAAGSPVGGTVNVSAAASDNVGVAGVQFLLDGNVLGAEDYDFALQRVVGYDDGFERPPYAGRARTRCRDQHHDVGCDQCHGRQPGTHRHGGHQRRGGLDEQHLGHSVTVGERCGDVGDADAVLQYRERVFGGRGLCGDEDVDADERRRQQDGLCPVHGCGRQLVRTRHRHHRARYHGAEHIRCQYDQSHQHVSQYLVDDR